MIHEFLVPVLWVTFFVGSVTWFAAKFLVPSEEELQRRWRKYNKLGEYAETK